MRQNARICVHFAFSGKSNSFDPIYPVYQAKHNKFEVSAWELNDPNSAEGKVYFIQPWLKPGDENRHKEAENDDSNLPDGYGIKDITAEYHVHNVPLGPSGPDPQLYDGDANFRQQYNKPERVIDTKGRIWETDYYPPDPKDRGTHNIPIRPLEIVPLYLDNTGHEIPQEVRRAQIPPYGHIIYDPNLKP